MSAHEEDIVRRTSAEAHADQPGSDKGLSGRYAKSRRTMARWREEGPPQLRAAQTYILNCPNPFRALATLKVAEIQARLDSLSTPELIDRYLEILEADKNGEAKDTLHDVCGETPWVDRSLSSERDAAHDLEKAACERLLATRRVPLSDERGR